MGKAPGFYFYPNDWMHDLDDQDIEIEGAWIRICCRLHWSNSYGQATKTLREWSRILRKTEQKTKKIFQILFEKDIASGSVLDNQNVTIISRRMVKDFEIRKTRQEVGKLGGNPKLIKTENILDNQSSNQKPPPSIPIPISYPNTINKESSALLSDEDIQILEETDDLAKRLWESKKFPKINAFLNWCIKENYHPHAINHTLKQISNNDVRGQPWAYGVKVIKIESQNFTERDQFKRHAQFKKEERGEL